ncbi:hypothetical protein CEXT_10851 [Caerostris extrusa]|uniref:Uncharacterized protein n=1 Tax=Caerostris extrusa TaxID=172846 RepID=A0AAV4NSF8_CAEEX|nr:hypothetical protein CEXT_10851 [Caerostris extrusa]
MFQFPVDQSPCPTEDTTENVVESVLIDQYLATSLPTEDTTEKKVLLLFRFPTREGVIKNRSSDHTRSSSPTSRIVLEEVVSGPSGCGGGRAAVRCLQPIFSKSNGFLPPFKTILCDPF